ncbi:hypothetical protein GALMADRAFT_1133389 [Galerina marginata CBS 339.88]|uniref:NodB homology domain-containing protein n=1 Tax=Galerina marginata (strain CBS 339.88) TaxID=685588 RepID=A0A067SAQ2_GALM3|nr:hypothetical protein GALMADRAFT_1133389 [Galerina marginata CBS 339.88]
MLVTGSLVLSFVLSCLAVAAPVQIQKRAPAQLITKCTVPNTAALTFDDGPFLYLNYIVDAMKAAGAKGTFFFNGNNWGCIYDDANVRRVLYAYANGFQVASHTWAHRDLTKLSQDQVNSEMAMTEQAIQKITGAIPAYTRPPFGYYNDNVLNVAGNRGQTLVNWDFDSGDSTGASVNQEKGRYDDLITRHPSTVLSLAHEIANASVHEALPYAIQKLQGAGYKLVTVSECLGTKSYLSIGWPAAKDGSWHC